MDKKNPSWGKKRRAGSHARESMVICFEGPDFSGKSTIAKKVASDLVIPYFKNSQERIQRVKKETIHITRYAMPFFLDFLEQVPTDVILDRWYPSEWVYSQIEKRKWQPQIVRQIDRWAAELDTAIIICYKSAYEAYQDEATKKKDLAKIFELYQKFAEWTQVKNVFFLDTTSQDIEIQEEKVLQFLDKIGYVK